MGSSPLARGLLMRTFTIPTTLGIIPARAGFTLGGCRSRRLGEDHPRSRGVYVKVPSARQRRMGSSPLARGLRRRRRLDFPPARIIPARAGFTRRRGLPRHPDGDHPRSRGVYRDLMTGVPIAKGSSPLARGLQPPAPVAMGGVGIIPARAGFTARSRKDTPIFPDHPRSRGVYCCPRISPGA